MNPYPERIEELHLHLERVFGQKDRQATEILLAALIPRETLGRDRPWIIIETDWPRRDCEDAWFAFGGVARPRSLAIPRVYRWRECEALCAEWIEGKAKGNHGIFVESEWRVLNDFDSRWRNRGGTAGTPTAYRTLVSQCVRLRVAAPYGPLALQPDKTAALLELARLSTRVLDGEWRTSRHSPPRISAPKSFLYWSEIVRTLAPAQTDFDAMASAFVAAALGIPLLYMDGRAPDWSAVERLMRDTVHQATHEILRQTALKRSEGVQAFSRWLKSGDVRRTGRAGGGGSASGTAGAEIKRLLSLGILAARRNWKPRDPYLNHPWKYRVANRDYADFIDRGKTILV